MKLTFFERMALFQILPQQGDFITIRKIKEFSDKLIFTDQEIKDYDIKFQKVDEQSGRWIWDKKWDSKETEIEFGEIVEKEITEILKKKNDTKTLSLGEISLYEKIVEPKKG